MYNGKKLIYSIFLGKEMIIKRIGYQYIHRKDFAINRPNGEELFGVFYGEWRKATDAGAVFYYL